MKAIFKIIIKKRKRKNIAIIITIIIIIIITFLLPDWRKLLTKALYKTV